MNGQRSMGASSPYEFISCLKGDVDTDSQDVLVESRKRNNYRVVGRNHCERAFRRPHQ